ncbi:hypothetical protein HPB49_024902 [Dermacentor silvarum]|uniref:Uncharacterized protein n=1 Tax=Dermacentor silvarum TaxID=543639 RepID=A0ACB8C638_DERSI|nr:hypothetical protein HPB49_024902 [Dermacentor silvarum]
MSLGQPGDKSTEVDHVELESVLCDVIGIALQGRKSLFATRLKKPSPASQHHDFPKPPPSVSTSGSALSKDDYEAVHFENLGRLASMSHEEKMKARQELLSRLDPATVAFLQSRRKLADLDSSRRGHAEQASANCIQVSKDGTHNDASSSTKPQTPDFKTEHIKLDFSKPNVAASAEHKIDMPAGSAVDSLEATDAQAPALDEDELPIKPTEAAKKWIHMDEVEKDKLQWMTMLPPVKAVDPQDAATPCIGRFDFEGELVPPNQEVPVHRGLHHHGDNPEMAGYSTAEILRLLRSQVRSQRLLALQLLERILTKHWLGHYVGRMEGGDLLMQLLQSGLAPLVRSALDDRATVDAALAVLQALLVSQPEQALFGRAFLWRHGHRTFFLRPPTELQNSSEISDVDLSQIDLVQALLRMDLLQRLHYILKTLRPGASAVASALLVMARLARHSTQAATKVLNQPHLMNLIFAEFLPAHWSSPGKYCWLWAASVIKGKMAEAYGNPMWPALELVRTIAAAGKELADVLIQRHRLGQCLAAYLALEPSASQLPAADCLNLALEALRTWRILLTYGLGGELCLDLYSVVARRLQLFSALDLDGVPFDLEYGAHLLHCLSMLPADVARSSLAGLSIALNIVSKRWLTLLSRATDLQSIQTGVYIVAAMLHCLSSMCELGETPDTSVVDAMQLVLKSQLAPFLTLQLSTCSSLLAESERNKVQPDSSSSECLPCVASEEPVPCEGWDMASFELLASMARLLRTMATKSEVGKRGELSAVRRHWTRHCSQRWLCRPEFNLLFELGLLAASETLDESDAALYHEVSLALLSTCAPGFQHQYLKVLKEIVFAPNFACSQSSHWRTLSMENIPVTRMESITGCSVPVIASAKLDNAALSDIKDAYLKTLEPSLRQLSESASVSLTLRTKPLFSYDWVYLPLHQLCAMEEMTRNYEHGHVLSCLRWACHLLCTRHRFMQAFPPLVHFTRLASVFLAGPELFLDMEVQGTMLLLLRLLEQTTLLCRTQRHLDLKDWPGLPSFSDFYLQLLEEYVGESYGDCVFASWLLVPLQGACDPHFRKLFFAENPEALAMTRLKPDQA